MLNKEKHQLLMGRILRDIYADISLSSLLGFKGGTCAYFFYQLPRFSVDLDFDFLDQQTKNREAIFSTVKNILMTYGDVKDSQIKQNTIFLLLSYEDTDHNIKLEINTRTNIPRIKDAFELKEYMGISMLVARKSYLFASKLAALTLRQSVAMRDIYDIWFFATNNWDIDKEILAVQTQKTFSKHLTDCIDLIEHVKDSQILHGLGELIGEKEKIWVKTHLKNESVFLLKNYLSALSEDKHH